jgi:MFS family permease
VSDASDQRDESEVGRGSKIGAAIRGIAMDVTPLRKSRDFRLLWLGLLASTFGWQFTIVATYVQVLRLTGSVAVVGLLGLIGFAALVGTTLAAGTFLDAIDRRKVLLGAQFGYLASTGVLAAMALSGEPPVGVIFLAVAGIAGASAIDFPTRNAMTPRLLSHNELPAAAALNQLTLNGAGLMGPAIAGVVVGSLGFAWAYWISLISTLLSFTASVAIHSMPPMEGERVSAGWRAVRQGFSFLRGRRVLQSTFLIDIIATVFGNPRAVFPVLAATQFHEGPEVVGLLFAAPAAGAFLGAATSGWVGRVRYQGRAVIWAVVIWGAGITAFGLVGASLPLALTLLAIAGAADVISAVLRNTILQVTVPERLRGRLSGIHYLVVTGGPRLGDLEAGLVAAAYSPMASVISGGLLCMIGAAVVAWRVPEFRQYEAGQET